MGRQVSVRPYADSKSHCESEMSKPITQTNLLPVTALSLAKSESLNEKSESE